MSNEDFFFSCADSLPSPPNAAPSGAVATNITLSANSILDFDTQPVSNSLGDNLPTFTRTPPWGLLFGLASEMPQTQLTSEEYIIGRNDGAPVNIVLPRPPESEKSKLNMWLSYSRVQFRIRRRPSGIVEIEDLSSNGTFVNGKKLTKSVPIVLENNSEIALSLAKNRVLMFADLSILDDPSIPLVLRSRYRFSKQLGQGACGEVQLAFSRKTGVPVAIKIVHRSRFFTEAPAALAQKPGKKAANDKKVQDEDKHSVYAQAVREAKLMQTLSHPCIIKIFEVFDEPPASDMFLVLEYAQGGELFDKIVGSGRLSESFAKYIFFQVVLAVQYLHSQGITHRDLKPENILLSSDDDYPIVKLADFGLSKMVDPATVLRTYCGTPTYLAPEIVRTKGSGVYSKKVDLWSLGVILFAGLAGYPPFYVERQDLSLEEQIMTGSYSFPSDRWAGISLEAIALIKALLTVEPSKRLSADQAVVHPWMSSDLAMLDKVNEVVFGSHGISYYWSKNGGELAAVSGYSRGRGIGRNLKPVDRLSSVRTNESDKSDYKEENQKRSEKVEIIKVDQVKRPSTADGVQPLRRKNKETIENGRPGAVSALGSGPVARYVSPGPTKQRGVAGENSRRLHDPLSSLKTPKVPRRGK